MSFISLKDIFILASIALVAVTLYPFFWINFVYKPKAKKAGCGAPLIDYGFPLGIRGIYNILNGLKNDTALEYFKNIFPQMGAHTGYQCVAGQMWIGTIEPENIKTILATSFKDYSLGFRYDAMFSLLGNGIFTLSGDGWKHSRAMLRPQFSKEQVSHLDSLSRHINLLMTRFSTGEVVDAQELFHRLTIDTATEFLFGESTNTLDPELANHEFAGPQGPVTGAQFATSFTSALELLSFRVAASHFWYLIWSPKFWRNCRVCHNFIDYFVQKSLDNPMEKDEYSDKYVFIRELTKETRDPKAIRDQALNILLAGRDTTAALLSFTTFYMSAYPEIYQELRESILAQFGPEDAQVTFEQLKQNKLLQNVIREVLRLHPIVPLNFRTAIRDTKLPTGAGPNGDEPMLVPKGQNVFYSPYAMQRNADIWGADANDFRPQRWTESRTALAAGWDYIPFNGGPRICIGQQFALTEASIALLRMCQEFKSIEVLHPDPRIDQRDMRQKMRLTSSVAGGVIARFHKA